MYVSVYLSIYLYIYIHIYIYKGPDIGWGPASPVVWGVGSLFPLWGGCGVLDFRV